jgi:hypothetical protein
MRRDPSTKNISPLENEYLDKMGEYRLDIHTLIRSTVECNNDEVDKTKTTQGYPRCYFGLPFAVKVAVSSSLEREMPPSLRYIMPSNVMIWD